MVRQRLVFNYHEAETICGENKGQMFPCLAAPHLKVIVQ